MKYIYLDTAHFIKWQNRTLSGESLALLDNIARNDKYCFVFSEIHGVEISNRSDRSQVINDFNFMGKLKCVELIPMFDLYKQEVINAYSKFNGKEEFLTPFQKIEGDIFSIDNVNKLLLTYTSQQVCHQQLNAAIASQSAEIIPILNAVSKDEYRNALKNAFKSRLKLVISELSINDNNDIFSEFIFQDNKLVPSLRLNFYADFNLLRNNKTKNVTVNDWFDVLHYNAAPYVNYFLHDREACSRIRNVIKFADIDIAARISHKICSLFSQDQLM